MERQNNSNRYLVTPTLLNAWGYIWESANNVKEAESDTICLEDKQDEARQKAYDSFLKTLNREKSEPTKYMQQGIEFEEECYKGNTCISPIIEGGAYQIVGMKRVTVDGMDFLMYGRLDVLKGGVIYDIKRVVRYTPQKYLHSYQHRFYLDLFESAKEFQYLAYDGNRLHIETYYRDNSTPTEVVISNFIAWLKQNNLLEIYKEKWRSK